MDERFFAALRMTVGDEAWERFFGAGRLRMTDGGTIEAGECGSPLQG